MLLLAAGASYIGPRLAPRRSYATVDARRSYTAAVASAAPPLACDYLVVGAGASGMAFIDTLLEHAAQPVTVVLLDKRAQAGGHWNDAYSFVTLHQPARNYGVESRALEAHVHHPELLASPTEILEYYNKDVMGAWDAAGHRVRFVGGATYDFGSSSFTSADGARTAVEAAKVVDARFTENDLPLHVAPKFTVPDHIQVIPPNELPSYAAADGAAQQRRFCVLGAGKTGQDSMLYLRNVLGVPAERIVWVMPNDPWITARDPPSPLRQNTCMEFVAAALEAHAAAGSPPEAPSTSAFLQRGFERLEAEGLVYRIDPQVSPSKFMDATLNRQEVDVLRGCLSSIVRGKGRVAAIGSSGELLFEDGSCVPLPWAAEEGGAETTFVHCTAGAFNFGASAAEARRPVFSSDGRRITVQEIFQFPGFCFNGAVIAWLESQDGMTPSQKNRACELPPAGLPPASPLGTVAGNLGPLDSAHPLLVSLRNLRRWYATASMGEWLHSLRLFSLSMNGYSLEEGKALAERNYAALVALGLEAAEASD